MTLYLETLSSLSLYQYSIVTSEAGLIGIKLTVSNFLETRHLFSRFSIAITSLLDSRLYLIYIDRLIITSYQFRSVD